MLMVSVGFAFKLSIVPFHFWCPDAFQGAPAEVGGFLSIASKAAAFALLVRLHDQPDWRRSAGIAGPVAGVRPGTRISRVDHGNIRKSGGLFPDERQANAGLFDDRPRGLHDHGGFCAARPCKATNVRPRRAGYRAIQGLLYYLCVYLFMNLGAFAIVAFIRNQTFSEEIDDYKGLGQQAPLLAICMAICMFSLVGIPPLGGFYGKAFIFASVYQATNVHWFMWVVLVAGGVNTVISLFYYLRVAKYMCMYDRAVEAPVVVMPASSSPGMYVMLLSGMVVFLGVIVNPLAEVARRAAHAFL